MPPEGDTPLSPDQFVWKTEHEATLEQIAETDKVEIDWPLLSNIIRHKLTKNTSAFLDEAKTARTSPPPFSDEASTTGGLRQPPWPPRPNGKKTENPKLQLNEAESKELLDAIFSQLADFENAPFTIQRICELCVNRRQHYTSTSKYLRAVEKALLVTSTWDAFPASSAATGAGPLGMGATLSPASSVAGSVPSTPMFSPIPFLHEDARRSQSRSPPPLALEPSTSNLGNPPAQTEVDAKDAIEPRALGLVDEMDDPGPGHMSDKPVALSSVTTVPDEQERGKEPKKEENTSKESAPLKPEASERKPSRSLFSSLKERFVGSSEKKEDLAADQETMDLDENDDKENQKK